MLSRLQVFTCDMAKGFNIIGEFFACTAFHCNGNIDKTPVWQIHWDPYPLEKNSKKVLPVEKKKKLQKSAPGRKKLA